MGPPSLTPLLAKQALSASDRAGLLALLAGRVLDDFRRGGIGLPPRLYLLFLP